MALLARYKIVDRTEHKHLAVLSTEEIDSFRKEQKMHVETDKLDVSERGRKGEFKVSDLSIELGLKSTDSRCATRAHSIGLDAAIACSLSETMNSDYRSLGRECISTRVAFSRG